jgi:electron transport complex protein RnfC
MLGLGRHRRTFDHGIHPPESKDDTRELPIRQFPFAPVMVIPLLQHMGVPAKAVVREGQEVQRGQLLAEPDGFMSVAMHAPASGTVQRLGLAPSITGKMVPAVYLRPFPGSSQEVAAGEPCLLERATPDEILTAIQWAGIVGLGGAAFPTHVKLKIPQDRQIDTLILNGVECEPYLTTDHRVMLEQQADIFTGIRYLMKVTGAARALIGVEGNKLDVAESLRRHLPGDGEPVGVVVVEVKYPQGAEKMLITALLGREVPSGGLPSDVGVVVVNVATAAEIGRLLPAGRGIQERVITIGGPAIRKKGNYRIPIGTPLRFALEYAGLDEHVSRVFLGGPMMGQALPSLDIPITKGTSGFIAFSDRQTAAPREYPCIHCGYCVDACPLFLNPSRLGLLAKNGRYDEMAQEHHLMDCFECGSCAYVCPAHIPLVQRFRGAKAMVRKQKAAS